MTHLLMRLRQIAGGPIASATVRTSAVLGIRLLAQTGTLLVVVRMLGPSGFGAFAGVAALAVVLGTLSTFGTHLTVLRDVSQRPHSKVPALGTGVITTVCWGLLLLLAYLVITERFLAAGPVTLGVLACIGLAELVVQPLISLPSAVLQGRGRIARSQAMQISPLILRLAAAMSVWLYRPSHALQVYAYGYLAAAVVTMLLAYFICRSDLPSLSAWQRPRWKHIRDSSGFAILNVTNLGVGELDKTLAVKLIPLATAGAYAAGTRIIAAVNLPILAMLIAALPRLFRESSSSRGPSSGIEWWLMGTSLAYGSAMALLCWMVAPWITLLFGPGYSSLTHFIRLLTLAMPGMALRYTAGSVLMARGRTWTRSGYESAGIAVLVTASIFAVRMLGNIGMPLALITSESFMATCGVILIMRPRTMHRADPGAST